MKVTLLGMVTDFKFVQKLKALSPIVFTPFGMVKDVSAAQFLKAAAAMYFVVAGNSMAAKVLQFLKARFLEKSFSSSYLRMKSFV